MAAILTDDHHDRTAAATAAAAAKSAGADLISALAAESNEQLAAGMQQDLLQISTSQGRFALRVAEFKKREAFRADGATSVETWSAERFGVSVPTARSLTHMGEKCADLPHLVGSLCAGDISFDKVRAVADVATPQTDRELCDQARACTVRELVDLARTTAARAGPASTSSSSHSEHANRYLRFNDDHRTISAQLPSESYAATKARIDALVKEIASNGDTPLDQRRCDAFTSVMQKSGTAATTGTATSTKSPFFVVAHVPLEALVNDSGDSGELVGELEHGGLIDRETVQRIACDATIAVAVDDNVGHTMYEGRAQRFATPTQRREVIRRDRHCRFPGCTNVLFAEVHHVIAWKPGGLSDLPNLALLCEHHHRRVHSKGWAMSGNANEELTIVGPSDRVMTSRPSPLWTRVTGGGRSPPPN